MTRCCAGKETAPPETNFSEAEIETGQPQRPGEENSVRNNMNRKRVQKEEKMAERKAAKKAAKGKR